jgi:hypothetical protein
MVRIMKFVRRIAALVLSVVPMCRANTLTPASLVLVPDEQLDSLKDKLDPRALPAGTEVDGYGAQDFMLVYPDAPTITVVPVSVLVSTGTDTQENQCGVYFLGPNKTSSFVPLWTKENVSAQNCFGIRAVGKMPDPGPRPRLLFLFENWNSAHEYKQPYLLFWDDASGHYKLDRTTSHWLLEQTDSETIAGLKRLLSKPGPKIPQGKY